MPVLPDPTTPQAGPVYTPEYFKGNAFEKPFVTDFDTDSPDSGHKEMSTESLAVQYQNSNTSYWQNVLNGELISLSSPSSFAPGTICHVVECDGLVVVAMVVVLVVCVVVVIAVDAVVVVAVGAVVIV